MISVPKIRRRAVVLAVVMAILLCFLVTLPGQQVLDHLERLMGLSDFQDVSLEYPFSLHVIDVGKADALCIIVGEEVLLVDGGTAATGPDVVNYLRRLGITQLAAVINTHPDEDHSGGLAAVLQAFPCCAFYVSELPSSMLPSTAEICAVQRALDSQSLVPQFISAGDTLHFGELTIEVLSPAHTYDSTNNNSLVLRLTFGCNTFLLMGDAEAEVEADLLALGINLSADVLKVGHHGSKTSSTEEFIRAVSPRYAVISTGEDNNHLPKAEVLVRLDACEGLYRTDTDGTVIFCSDGTELTIYTQRVHL